MNAYQIISQLTAMGVSLSVSNGRLTARLPWQKDNIPADALGLLRQVKIMQDTLLESLTWNENRALEMFKAAIGRGGRQYQAGLISAEDVTREMGSLREAEKTFNSGIDTQNMQQVIASVQAWDMAVMRCRNGS
jgi:hypothetical protein